MSKNSIIIFSIIGIFLLFGGVTFGLYVSANNTEIKLRSKTEAQKKVCEAYFDKMWKIINQKAQVADKYKQSFKEIYPALIDGRYKNDKNTLMKWITESNPTFDTRLYQSLSESIEAERTGFFMEQEILIDLQNQHHITVNTFPNSLFIGNRKDVEITIVSSSVTKKVMETGKEDSIKI